MLTSLLAFLEPKVHLCVICCMVCLVDCGFKAHRKCADLLPNDCMPTMKKLKRMFGLDLTTLLKATNDKSMPMATNKSIPMIVEKCVEEIERRGRAVVVNVD